MTKEYFDKIKDKLKVGTIVYIDGNGDNSDGEHRVKYRRKGTKCIIRRIVSGLAYIHRLSDYKFIDDYWVDRDYTSYYHFSNNFRIYIKPKYLNE